MATNGDASTSAPKKEEDTGVAQITVSSRIPEFWEDQPMTWFIQAEAVLYPQKLADVNKYHLLITKLGKGAIQQVTDILRNPPETNKYDTLKARLLAIYEESENRQIQKLMGEMDLGDQKPSQLLRRMQELARDKFSDQALCVMWQNHLPLSVRAVLAVSNANDATVLASIADKVMEVSHPGTSISAVSATSRASTSVVDEIAKINVRLANMERSRSTFRGRGRGRGRGRSQSRHRSSTPRRTPDSADWLCVYHFKYKNRAHRCVEPCAWKKQQHQGN